MLVIRMQRTGRKGHAQFRVVVQDSRRTPTSGKVVAQIGTYDPHSKEVKLDKERAAHYLEHGAQPSPRAVMVLKSEGVKLPSWVKDLSKKSGKIRHTEKLRRNQPKVETPKAEEASKAVETTAEETAPAAETENPEPTAEVEATTEA